MDENQVVYEFEKNPNEVVRLEFCKFKSADYINLRIFYQADDGTGNWIPTKKGITIHADFVADLKEAVDRAYQAWQKKGNRESKE